MAVYIINNMNIHDRAEYETYLRSFGLWGRSALKKFASNS